MSSCPEVTTLSPEVAEVNKWIALCNVFTYLVWSYKYFENEKYLNLNLRSNRGSRPEVFCKKGALRNFTKFTGKHLCQSLFFRLVAFNFIKKETLAQVFSREFCEISKDTFFYQTPQVATSRARRTDEQNSTNITILQM